MKDLVDQQELGGLRDDREDPQGRHLDREDLPGKRLDREDHGDQLVGNHSDNQAVHL